MDKKAKRRNKQWSTNNNTQQLLRIPQKIWGLKDYDVILTVATLETVVKYIFQALKCHLIAQFWHIFIVKTNSTICKFKCQFKQNIIRIHLKKKKKNPTSATSIQDAQPILFITGQYTNEQKININNIYITDRSFTMKNSLGETTILSLSSRNYLLLL